MPSIDPTEVPLFASSVCVFVDQAHLLLPPPLSWRQSHSPLTLCARYVDWPIHHVLKDCLLPDANIMFNGVHSTLLEHVTCGRVDPHIVWSSPRLMFLSHAVSSPDAKPLQPCQCSLREILCLAAVKEDPLHNRLVEHGADLWWSVIRLEDLSYPGPCPVSLLNLVPHCPDVLIILGKNLSKVTKRVNLL